ncbi:MAG TPA: ester cyclase [Dehalococcoidia bacterium]|nr:ester cyclase [Dehalococcoidia bacterium]
MPDDMPDLEANKALVRRYFEIIDAGDVERIDEVLAPDFVSHSPPYPGLPENLDGVRRGWAMSLAAFTGYSHVIEQQVAEGDRVATLTTASGTHTGEYRGLAGTGRQVSIQGISIHRIAGGRIAEHWGRSDILGLLQQMGGAQNTT